jgi:hypothetical protein
MQETAIKPLGPEGGKYALPDVPWLAPGIGDFPVIHTDHNVPEGVIHVSTPQYANLIQVHDEEDAICISFHTFTSEMASEVEPKEETIIELSDEMAEWLVKSLTLLLKRRRDAELRGEND